MGNYRFDATGLIHLSSSHPADTDLLASLLDLRYYQTETFTLENVFLDNCSTLKV